MHGLLMTLDEVLAVSDLSKMTISKNKEEREETRSSIADNFILTDQLPGHLEKGLDDQG